MKCTKQCSTTRSIAKILVVIGAINWGLVGIGILFNAGNLNVVNLLLGSIPWLEGVIYLLVGLSGIIFLGHCGGKCNKGAHAVEVQG